MNATFASHPRLVSVDAFPVDESVYGIRGLGGNVCDWVADPFVRGGPPLDGDRALPAPDPASITDPTTIFALRGGNWCGSPRGARAAYRGRHARLGTRDPVVSIRLVRTI